MSARWHDIVVRIPFSCCSSTVDGIAVGSLKLEMLLKSCYQFCPGLCGGVLFKICLVLVYIGRIVCVFCADSTDLCCSWHFDTGRYGSHSGGSCRSRIEEADEIIISAELCCGLYSEAVAQPVIEPRL